MFQMGVNVTMQLRLRRISNPIAIGWANRGISKWWI